MKLYTNQYGDEFHVNWDFGDLGVEWRVKTATELRGDVNLRIPKEAHEALLEFLVNGPPKPENA